MVKGKATPVTGRGDQEGYETSRLPHFLDQWSGKFFTYYSKIYLFTPTLPPRFEREKIIDYLNSKGLLNLFRRRIQL
jgi:hypothetical protein